MDISHIHPDIKDLFMMSNATTIQTRMTATVLICNLQPHLEPLVTISLVTSEISSFGSAVTFLHLETCRWVGVLVVTRFLFNDGI